MIPFNPKPNGVLKHTAVVMIILCISQNSFGLLEDPNRERFQERQSLADEKFGRDSLKTSPYIRDVRADSRQSRIDASDIRTDFREIRTELHNRFSRDLVRVDARRESRGSDQVRDFQNAQLSTRANQNRENTRQMGRADERSFREHQRVRSSQHPEATRVAERFGAAQLDSAQRRYSENPLLRRSASRCSRRSFEETQPPTTDRRRQFGERSAETRESRFRSAEDRTMETRSSSRRVLKRREDSNRRIRDASERSSPNSRYLERFNQESDKNRRDQQRTPLHRDNIDILNVRDLERSRRLIHDANVEQRDGDFGERQQRTFRDREESRQNSPDLEKSRRLMNQRRVREVNLQRARHLESVRSANRNANLQERRFVQIHRVRDLNEESRVKHRRASRNEESRKSGRTNEGRIYAENRRNQPISSPNVEREQKVERVVGNIRAQSEEAAIFSKTRNNQIIHPSKERRVVENADTKTESRSNTLVGYNRIVSDSADASKLVDLPARNGKFSNTWVNVAETLLVLALIGQVIGGTSKGKFRCLSWQGLFPKQKVL